MNQIQLKLSIYQKSVLFLFVLIIPSCGYEDEELIEKQVQSEELEFKLDRATLLADKISEFNVENNPALRANPPAIKNIKTLKDSNNKDALYLFNYENDNGFTIISGDKRLPPVLAQTDKGSFDYEELKNIPALNFWMNSLIEEIEIKRLSNIKPSKSKLKKQGWADEIENFRIDYIEPCSTCEGGGGTGGDTNYESHGPLIGTRWGQGCGFNDFTPEKNNDDYCGHSPSGCGPVAVAQVMWHHRNELGNLSFNGVPINFNLASMPPSLFDPQLGDAPDIARLMSFIGTDIIIDYAKNYAMALPSRIPDFFEFMGFNSDLRDLDHGIVKSNIRNGNPVIFKARTQGFLGVSFNHHIWVCEGYRSVGEGQYWMNWGWRGAGDGWYYISDWKPSNSDSNYSHGKKMITITP